MNSPIPTLARGMAKRMYRELDETIYLDWPPTRKHSRRGWFKYNRAMALKRIGPVLLFEDTSYPYSEIFYYAPTHTKGWMQLKSFKFDAKRGHAGQTITHIFIVKHCIERVFQRLGATQEQSMAEFKTAIRSVWMPSKQHVPLGEDDEVELGLDTDDEGNFGIRTAGGMFFGHYDSYLRRSLIKTFVDEDKLRPDQRALPVASECGQRSN